MYTKSINFQKLLRILILILFPLINFGFRLPENNLEKLVYVVYDESDYFRLIPIFVNNKNNIPILFLSDKNNTSKLENFQKYYGGTSIHLSSKQIDGLILTHFSNPTQIVISDSTKESMLIASLISSAMQIPFFIEPLPADVGKFSDLSSIIAVGNVNLNLEIKTENLDSLLESQNFYNQLVENSDTSVVISNPDVYFIGAEAVAYHQAKVFFTIEDGKRSKTENMIWVTPPVNLGQSNFSKLYAIDSKNNVNNLYSQNIGIITGFTVEDMSFLLARTFAYHDLQGDWKKTIVAASAFSGLPSKVIYQDGKKIQTIGEAELNRQFFNQAISSASYVFTLAHGSVSGLRFNDGGWPEIDFDGSLPPLLFVAEACSTMDFNDQEMDQSIVLKIISSGAVAFLGSMEIGGVSAIGEYPYLNSTRQVPLGELVRMQNSILMDFAADKARVILIGDPTFFQTIDQAPAMASITPESSNEYTYNIMDANPETDIFLHVQSEKAIVGAIATLKNGRRILYLRGANYFARPMGVISDNSNQEILLTWPEGDGKIVFFDNWTLPLIVMSFAGDSLLGVKTLLLDLVTISNFPWGFTIVIAVLLLLSRKRLRLKKNTLLLYLIGSLVFSILVSLIYFEISFSIRIPVTLALFLWTFLSLCFFEKKERVLKKYIQSNILFLIPFLYGLFVTLAIGVASKTSIIVLNGVILLGVSFFVLQFLLQKIQFKFKS